MQIKRRILVFWLTAIAGLAYSQEQLIREGSVEQRQSAIRSIPRDPDRARTLQLADSLQLPSRLIYPDGRIMEIRRFNINMIPEYLTTFNSMAARTVATDKVRFDGNMGYSLDGDGLVVGVWDGGVPLSTHVEFGDRVLILDGSAEVVGHATHVSGTIGASGVNGQARGMADKAVIEAYDWDQDIQEMDAAAGQGLLLSNHSYGYVSGWDYNSEESRWEWWGDLSISEEEDYKFGYYHREAYDYDRIAHKHPNYMIVKSAGNDRGVGPSPGSEHYVMKGGEWVSSTDVRQKDGGDDGFDSMGPTGNAKNILSVGAIKDLPLGYTGSKNVMLTSFSAFGPTDDGRVKPDLVANGDKLYSSYSGSNTDYRSSSGTSMSAPNTTGSLALIQQQHSDLYGSFLSSAALKGLVLHTANEAGNPGPDYKFGWGVLNTLGAVDLISDTNYDRVHEERLNEGGEYRVRLYSSGDVPIRVTLCWTDPAGIVPAPSLNPVNRILVNDLDVKVVRLLDGREIQPYILDPLHPDLPATRGDNVLDNVEQILESTPLKGFYDVIISHKGTLSGGSQYFAAVFSGLTDEYFASGVTELKANNGEFKLTSASEYLPDMDAAWHITPENNQAIKLYFEYFATELQNDPLYIYDGADDSAPLLARLDGMLDPDTLEFNSTSGHLFVRFLSDGQIQDRGFRAIYCTTAPEDTALIQGEPFPCSGSRELYLATGVAGVDYLWTPPDGWAIDSLIPDGAYLEIGTGTGTLEVTVLNRCGSGPTSSLILSTLDSVPRLTGYSGDSSPCAAVATSIEVDELEGASYEWSIPPDWLGSSVSHRLEYLPGYNPGVISVNVRNACGAGDTTYIPIAVTKVPGEVQILTSRDRPCAMSEQEFYVEAKEGESYLWETIDDWSILDGEDQDSVLVAVGEANSFMFVNVTNKCGTRQSNKIYITSPVPDQPLIQVRDSEYEGYKLLSISNSGSFSSYHWYLNDLAIQSDLATEPEFVAYLPGLYGVAVSNREGCINAPDAETGVLVAQENQIYSVYAGRPGEIVVLNHSSSRATVNIYDFMGRIITIDTADPGYNSIYLGMEGAFIVTVFGSDNTHTTRVFAY